MESHTHTLAAQSLEYIALPAGAAIGALDAVVRRQGRSADAWRRRLALGAAVVTASQAGRIEDEAALLDAVLLTRPGDDAGPAGRMFLGGSRLAGMRADKLLTAASLGVVLDDFGLAHDDGSVSDLTDGLRQLTMRSTGMPFIRQCGSAKSARSMSLSPLADD